MGERGPKSAGEKTEGKKKQGCFSYSIRSGKEKECPKGREGKVKGKGGGGGNVGTVGT